MNRMISATAIKERLDAARGFTLIELLFVAVIIAVLIGVAAPMMSRNLARARLENFAKDIQYLGFHLQSSAVTERKIYCLGVDPEQGEFNIFYRDGGVLKEYSGKFGGRRRVPEGAIVDSGAREIYFYPDASIDEARMVLTNANKDSFSIMFHGSGNGIEIE